MESQAMNTYGFSTGLIVLVLYPKTGGVMFTWCKVWENGNIGAIQN